MTKTLTVIDLSSIFWQTWHATKDQEVSSAFDGTIHKVYQHVNGSDPVAIAVDRPPYLRKKISPDYKSQRDKPSAVAVDQLCRVIERLENDGFPVLGAAGYEADDILATIAANLSVAISTEDVALHIVSSDKDLLQLVEPGITATSPLTGEEFGPDEVHAKFGVWPEDMLRFLALIGDKSDNVLGVPGVGPKTAVKIINGDSVPDSIQAKLDEHAAQIELSTKLITLMDNAPIDVNRCFEPRMAKPTAEEPETEIDSDEPPPPVQAPQTQIVKREQSWALQLEPDDSQKAYKLAKILFDSKLYTQFANCQQILAVILRGRSLGLDATTSLDGFDVIQGRPSMSAATIVGLVLKSGKADYFKCIETTNQLATYKTHRSDDPDPDPTIYTFDMEMAKRMKLDGKDNWKKQPNTMLRARAATALARMVYPDVTGGLYTPDELSEGQYVDAEVIDE
jgi:5'-3' exonuclease